MYVGEDQKLKLLKALEADVKVIDDCVNHVSYLSLCLALQFQNCATEFNENCKSTAYINTVENLF